MKVTSKQVYDFYATHPKAAQKEAAAYFGVTPTTINYHLNKLGDMGVIRRSRQWRSVEILANFGGCDRRSQTEHEKIDR